MKKKALHIQRKNCGSRNRRKTNARKLKIKGFVQTKMMYLKIRRKAIIWGDFVDSFSERTLKSKIYKELCQIYKNMCHSPMIKGEKI